MPIYSLTKELFDKLKSDFIIKKSEIATLKKTKEKDMYLSDLKYLKKNLTIG